MQIFSKDYNMKGLLLEVPFGKKDVIACKSVTHKLNKRNIQSYYGLAVKSNEK